MNFDRNELEADLRDALDRFLLDRYNFQSRQRRVAEKAWQPDLWSAFAGELGILGASFPTEFGGLDGGAAALSAIMERFGAHLVAEPFLSTVVMGGGFLRAAEGEARELMSDVAAGNVRIAVAYAEHDSGHRLEHVATSAKRSGGDYILRGRKALVLDAALATHLVVVARTSGERTDPKGLTIFLLDAHGKDVGREDFRTIDGGYASHITLEDVIVPSTALIGPEGEGLPILERVIDEATAAICAEACGVMQAMLDQTIDYTRQRKQFGRAISENQVIQHRMVDMLIEVKESSALATLSHLKLESVDRAAVVSAAKSRIGRACRFVGQNAIQLHGGIGVADETAISHYFRRALMIEKQFGSVDHHLSRYEALQLPIQR
ncbi:MAG: acyl-CoA dehydrogenase domain protein [Sphingomonadales bacterium]|nr:acyl-CoA dehydrogenase domain protein [Sphingomonadales bacterium]